MAKKQQKTVPYSVQELIDMDPEEAFPIMGMAWQEAEAAEAPTTAQDAAGARSKVVPVREQMAGMTPEEQVRLIQESERAVDAAGVVLDRAPVERLVKRLKDLHVGIAPDPQELDAALDRFLALVHQIVV